MDVFGCETVTATLVWPWEKCTDFAPAGTIADDSPGEPGLSISRRN